MEILKTVNVGVCYYPEHWPRERWQIDIDNMLDMGMSVVRIAELAWSNMERRDGEFDFDWLEDFVNLAGKKGLKTILGTPSEATPVWLRAAHPEIVRVNDAGVQHGKTHDSHGHDGRHLVRGDHRAKHDEAAPGHVETQVGNETSPDGSGEFHQQE